MKVLFVCVHNSGRSQMAEAFTRTLSGGTVDACSAGTIPDDGLNPVVAEVMEERGIPLAGHYPKVIDQQMVDNADYAFTMGCAIDAGLAQRCSFQVRTGDWKTRLGNPSKRCSASVTKSKPASGRCSATWGLTRPDRSTLLPPRRREGIAISPGQRIRAARVYSLGAGPRTLCFLSAVRSSVGRTSTTTRERPTTSPSASKL